MTQEKQNKETLYRVTFTERDSKRKYNFDIYARDPETAKKKAKESLFKLVDLRVIPE